MPHHSACGIQYNQKLLNYVKSFQVTKSKIDNNGEEFDTFRQVTQPLPEKKSN